MFSGPGVAGLAPREASDRLQVYQAKFDELWRKYVTFSSGEELFGLPVRGTCVFFFFLDNMSLGSERPRYTIKIVIL